MTAPRRAEYHAPVQIHDFAGGRGSSRRLVSQAAFLVLPALLYVYLIWNIYQHARAIPVLDDWDLLPRLERLFTAQPGGWRDIFRQFGDHWIFTATFLRAAFLWFVRDVRIEALTLTPLVTLLGWCGYTLLARATIPNMLTRGLLATFTAAALFSLHHASHWLWPITLVYPLTNLFVIAAVLVARRNASWMTLLGAAALCALASTTFSTGLASWIALLPLLWSRGYGKRKLLAWLGFILVAFALYARVSLSSESPVDSAFYTWFLTVPVETISYVLIVLGHPLVWTSLPSMLSTGLCLLIAGAGAIAALALGSRDRLKDAMPWISLWLFGTLGACLIAAGRIGLDVNSAGADRYMLISTVSLIALAHLLATLAANRRKLIIIVLLAGTVVLLVLSIRKTTAMHTQSLRILRAQACLEMPHLSDPTCHSKFISEMQLRLHADGMQKAGLYRLVQFPEDAVRLNAPASGNFEALGRLQITVGGQNVLAYGWAAFESCRLPEHVFLLTASGTLAGHARTGFPAPASSPCPGRSGWQAVLREDVLGSMSGQTLEAWAYDEERHALLRLESSKIVDRTLLQLP